MADLENRIRLLFQIAYSRLAERGIISDEELERLSELLDSLDALDEAALREALSRIGSGA
jgi:hypothetical protein